MKGSWDLCWATRSGWRVTGSKIITGKLATGLLATGILATGISGLWPLPVLAASYKWIDEAGNIVYSQRPPATIKNYETIKDPPKGDVEGARQRWAHDLERLDARRQARTDALVKKSAAAKEAGIFKRNCELARDKLQKTNTLTRVYAVDKSGTRYRIPEEERQERIAQARKEITQWCK